MIRILLLVFIVGIGFPVFSQLTVSGIAKDASCNSSGEVSLTASGGDGIYTYKIISNTCGEVLPPSQTSNVFKSLSTCSYTFEVSDGSGKKGTLTVSIGGNYLAPLITTSVNGCTFSVIVTRGSTPYKYEISTDNGATWSTSSQPSWTQMPNGNYLIRVTDACNVSRLVSTTVALDPVEYFTQVYYPFNGANRDSFEIFNLHGGQGPYKVKLLVGTDTINTSNNRFSWKTLPPKTCDQVKVIIQHACGTDIQRLKLSVVELSCVSFANGSLKVRELYGLGPWDYTFFDETNIPIPSTSNATNQVRKNSLFYQSSVKDACGDYAYFTRINAYLARPEIIFRTKNDCNNFASASLNITSTNSYENKVFPEVYDVECTTCIPISTTKVLSGQSVTIANLAPGKNTIKIKDTCGGTWTCTSQLVLAQFIGCDAADFKLVNSFIADNRPFGTSFSGDTITNAQYILKNSNGEVLKMNTTGKFDSLPPGNYKCEAMATGCQSLSSSFEIKKTIVDFIPQIGFNIGNDPNQVTRPCSKWYILYLPQTYLPYTLRDSSGKLINESGRNGNSTVFFNFLKPGKYFAKSELNCTVKEIILPDVKPTIHVETITPCPAGGSVTFNGSKNWTQWKDYFKSFGLDLFYYNNAADWYDNKSKSIFNYDTAQHTYYNLLPNQNYRFYIYSAFNFNSSLTTCPSDSIDVKMPNYTPPSIQNSASILCGNNGLLQFKVKNGSSPFSLQEKNATYTTLIGNITTTQDTLITVSGLSSGTHFFTLADACGNTSNIQSTLTSLDSITNLKNCDGSVTLAFYSFPGASYIWKNGSTILGTQPSINIPSPKLGDTYTLTFQYNNCQTDRSFTIHNNIPTFKVIVTPSKKKLALCSPQDSIVLKAVAVGTPYTSLKWNTGDTSSTLKISKGGLYTLTYLNEFGCGKTDTFTILQPSPLDPQASIKNISCYGKNDGTFSTQVTGGTMPYAYQWSTGGSLDLIQNLSKGHYSLKIKDSLDCIAFVEGDIIEPDSLTNTILVKNQSCSGVTDGSLSVIPKGGTSPYTYLWNNNQTTATITNLKAGIYSVIIKDASGCMISRSGALLVGAPLESVRNDSICFGSKLTIANKDYNKTGSYSISLKTNLGCDSTVTLNLVVRDSLAFSVTKTDPLCFGIFDGTIKISPQIAGSYQYFINDKLLNKPDTNKLKPDTYVIKIKNKSGCENSQSITILSPAELKADLGKDTTIRYGDSIKLNFTTVNFNKADIIKTVYSGIPYMTCSNCQEITGKPDSKSLVKVTITTKNGCLITDEKIVNVSFEYKIYAPNIIQLNSSVNNRFTLFGGKEVSGIKYLSVYNRWGDLIFTQTDFLPNDPNAGWDGTYKNLAVEAGVYLYDAVVIFRDGGEIRFKGDVTLLR